MRAKDDGRHNGHAGAGQTRDRASTSSGPSSRAVLPIPDVSPPGLTTYDAKDPDEAEEPIAAGTRQVRERFHGEVKWVKIELGSDMHDHRVDPHGAARVAMSLQ